MTTDAVRRTPAATQWTALSARGIRAALREGDLLLAVGAPVVYYICFYVPLHGSMSAVGIDYAQYLLPLIVVQVMFFVSMFACDRAAQEKVGGMGTRLRSLPVRPWVPPAARISANMVRAVAALLGALVIGTVFGFRFADPVAALVFVVLTLAFGAALVLGADALGTATGNVQLGATVLFVPQLLLVMVSTGFVPADGFPGWAQPFVRNQPVSQLAGALRGLAEGRYANELTVAAVWTAGLLILAAAGAVAAERKRR